MIVAIVLSIALPVCLVVILIGCLDCLFRKRRSEGFRSRDAPDGLHTNAFSVDICDVPNTPEHVTIEPLPDILSKVSTAPPLRPQITFVDRGEHASTAPLMSVQRSFPRDQLTYLNEIGSGWFGKAIESEAIQIVGGSQKSHVVVKILKDDASKLEQKQFLDEVHAYRCLDHANLMSLLGQCTEAAPYLVILEFAAYGNLKSFLIQHSENPEVIVAKNRFISLALDAAAGLACLHRHDYIHNDLAARNCLVMSDYTLKIGDYGISDNLFKNEYYSTGSELLPIRWMAPETLIKYDGIWTTRPHDKTSDMWSFGILLWEICSVGERPYDMLTDEAVLQGVVQDRLILPSDVDLKLPLRDRIWLIMTMCWQDASSRLNVEQAYHSLEQLTRVRMETVNVTSDFDQKWNQLKENQQQVANSDTDLGSRTALAGSFATDDSSSPSDKLSFLNGDTEVSDGIRSDDSIIDVGGDITITPIYQNHALLSTAENHGQSIQRTASSSSEDQVFVENEFTKTVPQSHMTPVKSVSQTAASSSAPTFQGHSSSSGTFMVNSYINKEQINANDRHVFPIVQEAQMKDIDSSKNDFSLNVKGHSLNKEASEAKETSAADKNASNLDSHLQTDDEDFSEFVRTSPTAPSVDFTDFASADNNPTAQGDRVSNDTQLQKSAAAAAGGNASTPLSKNVFAADENALPDSDINTFSDFVSSDPPNTSGCRQIITVEVNRAPSDSEPADLYEEFISRDDASGLDSSKMASDNNSNAFSDFISSAPTREADRTDGASMKVDSLGDSGNKGVSSQDMPLSQDYSLNTWDMDVSGLDLESQKHSVNLSTSPPNTNTKLLVRETSPNLEQDTESGSAARQFDVEKIEADFNQNFVSLEQFPSNLSSLTSDVSFLSDIMNVEPSNDILPIKSKALEADTNVPNQLGSISVESPTHAPEDAASIVFQERKISEEVTDEENNSSVESFDFLDQKISTVTAEPVDSTVFDARQNQNDHKQESDSLHAQPDNSFDLLNDHLGQKTDFQHANQISSPPSEDSKSLNDLLGLSQADVSHAEPVKIDFQKSGEDADLASANKTETSLIDF